MFKYCAQSADKSLLVTCRAVGRRYTFQKVGRSSKWLACIILDWQTTNERVKVRIIKCTHQHIMMIGSWLCASSLQQPRTSIPPDSAALMVFFIYLIFFFFCCCCFALPFLSSFVLYTLLAREQSAKGCEKIQQQQMLKIINMKRCATAIK